MSWGYSMALISIKAHKGRDMGLRFDDVMSLDSLYMVTKLMLTQYGSVMVFCGRDMKGFYNGSIDDLMVWLGWNKC